MTNDKAPAQQPVEGAHNIESEHKDDWFSARCSCDWCSPRVTDVGLLIWEVTNHLGFAVRSTPAGPATSDEDIMRRALEWMREGELLDASALLAHRLGEMEIDRGNHLTLEEFEAELKVLRETEPAGDAPRSRWAGTTYVDRITYPPGPHFDPGSRFTVEAIGGEVQPADDLVAEAKDHLALYREVHAQGCGCLDIVKRLAARTSGEGHPKACPIDGEHQASNPESYVCVKCGMFRRLWDEDAPEPLWRGTQPTQHGEGGEG